jgi:hypothetical protein
MIIWIRAKSELLRSNKHQDADESGKHWAALEFGIEQSNSSVQQPPIHILSLCMLSIVTITSPISNASPACQLPWR